jgi:hypothetical protein
MEYPKAIMTLNELEAMGFKRKELLAIYRRRNNGIAWKTGSGGKTSTILFSTQDLEKYRRAKCTGI